MSYFFQDLANRVARHLPTGWKLHLRMERGSAWVVLLDPEEQSVELESSTDRSLELQINDALQVAIERQCS